MDEKDRLGDKLRDAEKGREDQYFAQRDRELLAKLKSEKAHEVEAVIKHAAHMRCPKCGDGLRAVTRHEVVLDECPACHGMWVTPAELERVAARETEPGVSRWLRGLIRR